MDPRAIRVFMKVDSLGVQVAGRGIGYRNEELEFTAIVSAT